MPKLLMDKEYKKIYLRFLYLEIPNFIQITSLVSLLSFLLKNTLLKAGIAIIIIIIFNKFLFTKFSDFLRKEFSDPYSELNTLKINHEEFSKFYIKKLKLVSVFFSVVIVIIINLEDFIKILKACFIKNGL